MLYMSVCECVVYVAITIAIIQEKHEYK